MASEQENADRHLPGESHQLPVGRRSLSGYSSRHFLYESNGPIASITLNRPDRKNPLTFDSYAELYELFRSMAEAQDIKVITIAGSGKTFLPAGMSTRSSAR